MSDSATASFARLFDIIRRLRSPEGCPWDKAQTPQSLRASLVEEVWECVSAIDAHDDQNLREELGDLYLLVTMVAWMKEQEGAFTVESALAGIGEKLVRRHPHVFGSAKTESADQALRQWDAIKAEEKRAAGISGSALDAVPESLPPLEKAAELQKKAARVGLTGRDRGPCGTRSTRSWGSCGKQSGPGMRGGSRTRQATSSSR